MTSEVPPIFWQETKETGPTHRMTRSHPMSKFGKEEKKDTKKEAARKDNLLISFPAKD